MFYKFPASSPAAFEVSIYFDFGKDPLFLIFLILPILIELIVIYLPYIFFALPGSVGDALG